MTLPDFVVEFRPGAGPFYDETDPGALVLPGDPLAWATTPDHASLDIAGDIDLRIDLTLEDWHQGDVALLAKYDTATANRSFIFWIQGSSGGGKLSLLWTTDGTTATGHTLTSTVVPSPVDGRLAVRVTLDVNNGASGHTATFYTAPTIGGSWTTLGTAVTDTGTTSFFSSAAAVSIGAFNNGTPSGAFRPLRGTVHAAEVRNGIGGTAVADIDFAGHAAASTSIVDDAGRTWTIHGDANVTEGRDFPWVDLTTRTLEASWGYGRDNELDTFTTGTATIALRNDDRALDPDNTAGAWYGSLNPRTPFRLRAESPSLDLPGVSGADASTPDHASFAVTDLDVRVRVALDDWIPGGLGAFLVGQYPNVGGNNGWVLGLDATGHPALIWTANGTTTLTDTATAVPGFVDGSTHWLRCTLDVDNGASGHSTRFYTSTDGESWAQIGPTVTTAGVTSIFNSTAALTLNPVLPWSGRVHALTLLDGINGSPVVSVDFARVEPGAIAFVDEVGRSWTVNGAAVVTFDPTELADLYYGFVQGGFEQDYRPPASAVCRVDLVDMLSVLEGELLPADAYAAEILADHPAAWWRLDSIVGNEMTDSSGHSTHGLYGEVELEDPLTDGGENSARFEHVGDWRGEVTTGALPARAPVTLEAWVKFPRELTERHTILAVQRDYALGSALWFEVAPSSAGSPNGELVLRFFGLSGGLRVKGSSTVDDDLPHHVAVVIAGTTTADITFYVDGVAEAATLFDGTTGGPWEGHKIWTVGNSVDSGQGDFGLGGLIDEVAVYAAALDATRLAAHYSAGVDRHAGERSGARVERVLDLVGIPAAMRDIDEGDTNVGPADYDGQSAGEYLDRIAESEQGAFYVDHANGGVLRFRGRYHRLTDTRSTTSQADFTDEDDPAALHVEPNIQVRPNGVDSIINIVEAQWVGGTAVARDDVSVARYGPQSRTITTEAPTASAAEGAGQWLIRRYAEPKTRVAALTLAPDADDRLRPAALDLRISDRVTLRRHPQSVGSAVTNQLYVEGVSHTVADGRSWRVDLNLSHAEAADAAWIWGTSAWEQTTKWG